MRGRSMFHFLSSPCLFLPCHPPLPFHINTCTDLPARTSRHAFIRDELSKGRYDAALSGVCFEMLKEVFGRTLRSDLGPRSGGDVEVEDVC